VQDQIDYQLIIEKYQTWLREAPRTTLELLERIDLPIGFPWSFYLSCARRINLALWDAGYTSFPYDDLNPHWYWTWHEEIGRRADLSRTRITKSMEPILIKSKDILEPLPSGVAPLRTGTKVRHPWSVSTGNAALLKARAEYYLKTFDHLSSYKLGSPGVIFMNVICNLRRYYRQNEQDTIQLMLKYFCNKADLQWMEESIAEVWHLIENITPSKAIYDEKTKAMRRKNDIEDDVSDLLAFTKDGGEVDIRVLLDLFHEWNPDFRISSRELGVAISSIKGIKSTARNGKRYFIGVHIPSKEELRETKTPIGWSYSSILSMPISQTG
jgi:hypothetical protein